jgi:hypothetical protein
MADTKTTLPLSLHEATIARHFARDPRTREPVDDREIEAMHAAMVRAREAAEAAQNAHSKIMANSMQTQIANMRASRKVTFQHFEDAAKKIDAARDRAEREIARLEAETSAPPEPKHVTGSMLEAEIRSALSVMKPEARKAAINEAITKGDDLTLGAALRGPTLLTGLGDAEREALRFEWRQKHFPSEIERVRRLSAALADLQRGGTLLLSFIGGLTDGEAIKQAEQAEAAALRASKVA